MSQTLGGGYKQRLAKAKQDAEPVRGSSKLASLLMEQWAWGEMSAPKVQAVAHAAFQDGLDHPQIEKLAMMGTSGAHPGNCHRDLTLIAGQHCLTSAISRINVRLKVKEKFSELVGLDFLLPHKLFARIYNELPNAFKSCVLGGAVANIGKFWQSQKNNPKSLARPDLNTRPDLHKVVPLSIHGDGVSYMRPGRAGGKSLEVLSWCSLLCRGPTKITNFLLFLVVKTAVKDFGVAQTWPLVWKVLTWSLQALATGLWPEKNWEGNDFEDESSPDFLNRGTPLAEGFSAVVFVLRADIDFLSNHFHLNSPSSNTPCALCQADREADGRPWTDCRPTALWRQTCWTRASWAATHPSPHPFFQMAGSGIDLVYPDLMHTKHLGIDQLVVGSILTWMVKQYLAGTIAENLDIVWAYIQGWYKVL